MKRTLNIEAVNHLIKEMDLKTKCRLNDYLFPRSILYYHLHEELKWSLAMIGKKFDKDHATVINGIAKYHRMNSQIKQYPDFAYFKEMIESKIFDIELPEKQPYEKSLVNRVLECQNYFEMRLLQDEIKKSLQVA